MGDVHGWREREGEWGLCLVKLNLDLDTEFTIEMATGRGFPAPVGAPSHIGRKSPPPTGMGTGMGMKFNPRAGMGMGTGVNFPPSPSPTPCFVNKKEPI